jgi:hypothetical protein
MLNLKKPHVLPRFVVGALVGTDAVCVGGRFGGEFGTRASGAIMGVLPMMGVLDGAATPPPIGELGIVGAAPGDERAKGAMGASGAWSMGTTTTGALGATGSMLMGATTAGVLDGAAISPMGELLFGIEGAAPGAERPKGVMGDTGALSMGATTTGAFGATGAMLMGATTEDGASSGTIQAVGHDVETAEHVKEQLRTGSNPHLTVTLYNALSPQ